LRLPRARLDRQFVLSFRIKTDPYGGLLDPSKCRKSSLTFADSKSSFQHTIDVSGAYYKGTRPSLADGGRLVYARISTRLNDYGKFPTHDEDGLPSMIWITGNMAGCADAGCIWEAEYHKHLIEKQGMTQRVYDTRVFIKTSRQQPAAASSSPMFMSTTPESPPNSWRT